MTNPALSIIMPVYNAGNYVGEAVNSLLDQSFGNFELIIVNDGSSDHSLEVVNSYDDKRIRILTNETNRGIVYSRNKGLHAAKGRYIAPFDADDIALRGKLEIQFDYLQKNPDVGMVGSWAMLINEEGKLMSNHWKLDARAEMIPAILLFRNYFVQSAVMMRREAIPAGGYADGYDLVEDYRMWCDIADRFGLANYPQYLVKYRVHGSSNTQSAPGRLKAQDKLMFNYLFSRLGIEPTEEKFDLHQLIKNRKPVNSLKRLQGIERLLLEVAESNRKTGRYNQQALHKVLLNRWLKVCSKTRWLLPLAPFVFLASPVFHQYINQK